MSPALSKKDAIARLRQKHPLVSKPIHFANINASKDVWWFDIPLQEVMSERHEFIGLLVFDHKSDDLHYLRVPTVYLRSNMEKLFVRPDKETISLELSTKAPNVFQDVRPGGGKLSFRQFLA